LICSSLTQTYALLRYPASSLPTVRLPHLPTAATRSSRFSRHRRRSFRSPPGYEPDELPTALLRDICTSSARLLYHRGYPLSTLNSSTGFFVIFNKNSLVIRPLYMLY